MAITDRMTTFSNAQVITTTAVSTDVLDTNPSGSANIVKNLGAGQGMGGVVLNVIANATFVGGTGLTITLESDDNAGLATPTVHASIVVTPATPAAGTVLARIPLPEGNYERFVGLRYTVTGTYTGGAVDAFLTSNTGEVGLPITYASGLRFS
jgi:hypothetical protein